MSAAASEDVTADMAARIIWQCEKHNFEPLVHILIIHNLGAQMSFLMMKISHNSIVRVFSLSCLCRLL